jgi:NADPH-dependent 2,4-dienoyl-CoA reductase/sulfur reductase-like enzyme
MRSVNSSFIHHATRKPAVLGASIRKSRVCVSTSSSTPGNATDEEQQAAHSSDVVHTDALVIGGGPAGLAAAMMLAKRGWNVTVAGEQSGAEL